MRQTIWTIAFPLLCKDRDENGGGIIRNRFCATISRIICGF